MKSNTGLFLSLCSSNLAFDYTGKMLGQILVTKQTGPQGKVVSKVKRFLCTFKILMILFNSLQKNLVDQFNNSR